MDYEYDDALLISARGLTLQRDAATGRVEGATSGGVWEAYTCTECGEVRARTARFNGATRL